MLDYTIWEYVTFIAAMLMAFMFGMSVGGDKTAEEEYDKMRFDYNAKCREFEALEKRYVDLESKYKMLERSSDD